MPRLPRQTFSQSYPPSTLPPWFAYPPERPLMIHATASQNAPAQHNNTDHGDLARSAQVASTAEVLNLRTLHEDIQRIVQVGASQDQIVAEAVSFLARLTNAQTVAYCTRTPTNQLRIAAAYPGQQPGWGAAWHELLGEISQAACADNRVQIERLQDGLVAVAVPVQQHKADSGALAGILLLGGGEIESFVVIFQLTAGLIAAQSRSRDLLAKEWESQTACAMLELIGEFGQASDVKRGCFALVNAVQQHLGCERVALAVTDGRGSPCKLIAVSGMAEVNPRSELPRAIQDALGETVLRKTWTVWSATDDRNHHATAAHSKLSEMLHGTTLCSAPLRHQDESITGAWIFWGFNQPGDIERIERFTRAAAEPIGQALQRSRQSHVGPIRRLIGHGSPLRRRSLWAAAVAAIVMMFCLLPYRIACECSVEPVQRRFVVAPYAGVFEKSLVRPGDIVGRDQSLARMDGRELRIELATVAAECERAKKSRDANLAAGKVAASQLEKLELDRLEQKRQLLEHRAGNLEIKSPVAGVVVAGDLERTEGSPLTLGQALFEIAPLDAMVVEVAIQDEEISHVEVGQVVKVTFDAYPGTVWSGTLAKIHPRSEARDSENVFVGELALDNADVTLKPGMKGNAKIVAANHSLMWLLFHKLWNALSSFFGIF